MKRSELVGKLMKEGMSEKTLVNFTDKQLNNLAERMIGEQEVGGFKEGPGEKLTPELKHYNTIVKPQLLKAGFKDSYEKVMEPYGTENSMVYGDHNTGVNVVWDRKKGFYSVYVGNNKGLKTFQLGPNDPKLVANNVVKYALSLKEGKLSLNEQTTGYSTPDEYGQAVFKALGPNFLVGTHNIDYADKELPGTYNGYFLQKFKYGTKWGNDGVSLNFDAYYNNKEGKRKNAILNFKIIFSKIGAPIRVETTQLIVDKAAFSLDSKGIAEKILPKIKGITYNYITKGLSEQPTGKGAVIMKKGANPTDIKQVIDSGVNVELREKKNDNGKIDGQDFKILKGQKKKKSVKTDTKDEEVKEWVESLAENNYHSFTSKNEIMELINVKLNESETHQYGPNVKTGHNGLPEFMTYDAIVSNNPKIAPSKPKVDPGTKPNKPKTPFRPGPRVNPNPKALGEDGPKIAPSKPKVDPGTKPNKPKTPFRPGPRVNPNPKATIKGDKK